MNKLKKLFSEIGQYIWWKSYLFSLKIKINRHEKEHKKYRSIYCRKGFHKLYNAYIAQGQSGKRMRKVWYLKCRYCDYVFFSSPNDKKKYLDMTAKERSAWLKLASSLTLKHCKKIGASDNQDASASGN